MLRSEKPFSVLFQSFLHWIESTVKYVSDTTTLHYPGMQINLTSSLQQIFYLHFHAVLVTHNGFGFDFPVLLAEVERRPRQFASSIFEDHNINFSDTLPLLRKIKIKNRRVQHGIYGLALPIIDEERRRRESCWDCAWNRKPI